MESKQFFFATFALLVLGCFAAQAHQLNHGESCLKKCDTNPDDSECEHKTCNGDLNLECKASNTTITTTPAPVTSTTGEPEVTPSTEDPESTSTDDPTAEPAQDNESPEYTCQCKSGFTHEDGEEGCSGVEALTVNAISLIMTASVLLKSFY